ncbi:MAG: N-acetyltransferase [Chloroflexota bacterium]|nr:MAG: N-acetyltransferase [Chloroflexota bacterium]
MSLEFCEVSSPDDALGRAFFEIYEEAFPVEERDPTGKMVAWLRQLRLPAGLRSDRCVHFWAAVLQGSVAGMAIFSAHRDTRLGFIAYMAVAAEMRSQGLGSQILCEVVAQIKADLLQLCDAPGLGVCLEVECPGEAGDEAERRRRERRIMFYQRMGAQVVPGVDFVAPPLGDGLPAVPYDLMFIPTGEAALDPALTRLVVDTALLHGYGLSREDPYYLSAIRSLQASE